jgi:hypothetical protein
MDEDKIVDAITFAELVQHGRTNGGNIVNNMPWSFSYKGYPITHENDQCYLVCLPREPHTLRLTPDDVLVIRQFGLPQIFKPASDGNA